LFEAILPRQLDDLFGLAAVEVIGDETRRGAARAAIIEVVERAVEAKKIDP
jgi:hypothetical protein